MKTTSFNLIILDESGSMSDVTKQTISGCNETINAARSHAKKNSDAVRSLISVYAFQSEGDRPSRYILKNESALKARHITKKDYDPCGCTPLLDAVGSTLSELKAVAATHEDATGVITIITDGCENSSTHYGWKDVASLISQFKEKGWMVNLIGANIDVDSMGEKMHIDNRMEFTTDAQGTSKMWQDYNASLSEEMETMACEARMMDSVEERVKSRKMRSGSFFEK